MKARGLAIVATVFAMMTSEAATIPCEWNQSSPQTDYAGKVTLTLNGAKVSAMSVNAPGDEVRFTGDGMTFAADATITIAKGTVTFANDVVTEGALQLAATEGRPTWTGTTLYSDQDTVVFSNLDLDDCDIVGGTLCGNASGTARPYYVHREAGRITAQMQGYTAGYSTKCVNLLLVQDGSDVIARLTGASFVLNTDALGEDLDVVGEPATPLSTKAETGYGLSALTLESRTSVVRFAAGFVRGGSVAVAPGVRFVALNQNGSLESLSGAGRMVAGVDGTAGGQPVEKRIETVLMEKKWTTFASGVQLSAMDLQSVAGKLAGGSLSATPLAAVVCHFRGDVGRGVLRCQIQYAAGAVATVKGCIVEFRQAGTDVQVLTPSAWYKSSSTAGQVDFENDAGVNPGSVAPSMTDAGYCVAELSATFASAPGLIGIPDGFTGGMSGGTYEVRGTGDAKSVLAVSDANGLPSNGRVTVGEGGVLCLYHMANLDTGTGISAGTCDIEIGPGGKLLQGGAAPFVGTFGSGGQKITVDGGEVVFGYASTEPATASDPVDTAGSTYLNDLMLMNGAVCGGSSVRVGNSVNKVVKWRVRGTLPCVFNAGVSLLGNYNADGDVIFDVFDVTGSDVVDFTVNGDMKTFRGAGYDRVHVVKTGAGTMRINGVTDYAKNPTTVKGGVWMLGVDGAMNSSQKVVLEGGGLGCAAGTSNSLGSLAVTAASRIVMEPGAVVQFADSSAEAWTAGAKLNVLLPDNTCKVRFGTSSDALSQEQLRALQINGAKAILDEDGYVVPSGFGIFIR